MNAPALPRPSGLIGWCLALLLCLLPLAPAFAQDAGALLAIPALSGRVIDQTGTLTSAQSQALSDKLAKTEQTMGSQIVVLIVPSTQGEDIAAFAYRVADQWKIGRRAVGDGVLLVVAKNDRRVRIEVAKALEGAIPDLAAKQIIDRAITPAFKAGDFAGGLNLAIDQLGARIRHENLPEPDANTNPASKNGGTDWQGVSMFLFIGAPLLGSFLTAIFGRKLGSAATGLAIGAVGWWITTSVLTALVAGGVATLLVGALGNGNRRSGGGWGGGGFGGGGGWGGGGGGGGGFSSGGGGDFGGGGASGRW